MRKDGTQLDIHISVSEMQIGPSKKYTGMIRDISERKRMEEAVRESEERFRQLAESIDAVFGSRRRTNAKSSRQSRLRDDLGISSRDVVHESLFWLDHIHPDDQKRVSIAAACQAHLPYDEEYRIITPSGRVRWIRIAVL